MSENKIEDISTNESKEKKSEEAKWYVVHTYSAYENNVKRSLEQTIINRKLEDKIFEVVVPTEQYEIVNKNGKTDIKERKLFPGYVFVHMIKSNETWYVVRNTRGVTGFVGPGSEPVPLSEAELLQFGIVKIVKPTKAPEIEIVINVEVGERVVITDGVWADDDGVVTEVNPSKHTVKVLLEVMGRETTVEVDYKDIKKFE